MENNSYILVLFKNKHWITRKQFFLIIRETEPRRENINGYEVFFVVTTPTPLILYPSGPAEARCASIALCQARRCDKA